MKAVWECCLFCNIFINADNIVYGLSPLNPKAANFQAGRLMIERIKYLITIKETFAFETTLTTDNWYIFDNSNPHPLLVAYESRPKNIFIKYKNIYRNIVEKYEQIKNAY